MTSQPTPAAPAAPDPCKFCGHATALTICTPDQLMHPSGHREGSATDFGNFTVVCNVQEGGCGAMGGYGDSPADATKKWNRRAPANPPPDSSPAWASNKAAQVMQNRIAAALAELKAFDTLDQRLGYNDACALMGRLETILSAPASDSVFPNNSPALEMTIRSQAAELKAWREATGCASPENFLKLELVAPAPEAVASRGAAPFASVIEWEEKIRPGLAPSPSRGELREAAQGVIDAKFTSFGKGKMKHVQDESGEMVYLVGHEAIDRLVAALQKEGEA